MSHQLATTHVGEAVPTARATKTLLAGGVLAGPLFVVVALAQVLSRDAFDLSRHPLSMLTLGALGWIQIGNFVVTGLLSLGCAFGLRRVLRQGPGRTWAPLLLVVYGVGLTAAGIFVPDPSLGFPSGAPEGIPAASSWSWHAIVHAVTPPLAFLSMVAACFVLARRYASMGQRGWAAYSAATGVVAFALSAATTTEHGSVLLAIGTAAGMAWVSATAAQALGRIR